MDVTNFSRFSAFIIYLETISWWKKTNVIEQLNTSKINWIDNQLPAHTTRPCIWTLVYHLRRGHQQRSRRMPPRWSPQKAAISASWHPSKVVLLLQHSCPGRHHLVCICEGGRRRWHGMRPLNPESNVIFLCCCIIQQSSLIIDKQNNVCRSTLVLLSLEISQRSNAAKYRHKNNSTLVDMNNLWILHQTSSSSARIVGELICPYVKGLE